MNVFSPDRGVPLATTKTVVPWVPFKGALRIAPGVIVMHPATIKVLRELQDEHEKFKSGTIRGIRTDVS